MAPSPRYTDFDRLVARHRWAIERCCWYYADGDRALCADLVQEVLMVLWHRRDKLSPDMGRVKEHAWVLWQCRSVCGHYHRRKRLVFVPLDESLYLPEAEESCREQIEEMAVDLSPQERRLLDLLLEGYKIHEIARLMNIKPSSVSQLRYRMIERMRQTHNKQMYDDTRRS